MNIDDIREKVLSLCCHLSAVPIERLSPEGVPLVRSFFPGTRTVLVTGHHVTASLEWAWFPFAAERGGFTCAADLHARSTIEGIERELALHGSKSVILPYPDKCGISFKRLAAETDMGELGESLLFLHRTWGPWVHLRVLLTDALLADPAQESGGICVHCGRCTEACPGGALSMGEHDQGACKAAQQHLRDALAVRAEYRYKCEACARACPVGEPPGDILIRDKGSAIRIENRRGEVR